MLVLFIILFILTFVVLLSKKESFTPTNDKERFAVLLFDFITDNITFSEYVDFLIKQQNKSINITKTDVFYELKYLKKSNNLTIEKLLSYMTDY